MSIDTSRTLPINVEESRRYLKSVKGNRKIIACDRPTGWTWKHKGFDRLCPKSSPNICRFLDLSPPRRHGSCCPPGSLRFGPRTRSEEPCLAYYLPSSSLMTPCVGAIAPHPCSNQNNVSRITRRDQGPIPNTIIVTVVAARSRLSRQSAMPLELPRTTGLLPQELTLSLHSGRRLQSSVQGAQMCATGIYGFNNNNNNDDDVICSSFIVF
jgi:hypothetical protein